MICLSVLDFLARPYAFECFIRRERLSHRARFNLVSTFFTFLAFARLRISSSRLLQHTAVIDLSRSILGAWVSHTRTQNLHVIDVVSINNEAVPRHYATDTRDSRPFNSLACPPALCSSALSCTSCSAALRRCPIIRDTLA